MKNKSLLLSAVLMLVLSIVLAACGGDKKAGDSGNKNDKNGSDYGIKFLSIATGGTGGTYYPLGGNFANMIKDATGVEANATTSGASAENMTLIQKGEAEVAFTQTDIATYANEGTMMFNGKKVDNINGLGTLYPETIQIVTTAKSGIKSVADLKGKTVSVGEAGSGTLANAEQILEMYDLTVDDLKARNLSFDDSTTGIQDGTIHAAFITAGTPTGAVEGLAATEDVVIVPLESDKIDALIEKYPYYAKETIPSGTYGADADLETVAVQAMLVVSSELTDDLVYEMTKAIFENTDKIGHAKGKLIKAENALDGMAIELHPGAKKYFDEKGISAE
ncbi:TAXI family TRAP transporter solute-binding subunit [Lederbergia lenta]|uniref:TRAP transporter solute receptor, TAXI family n=1 Tax=Lederbergia lenta TaxID=1467 RepID=A0A2X4WT24_LEDLE|nr:TAXI family TRAP transporter solute-binding subunit [Lederbergia lenta]MCM3110403.1 TAXI family TRAP transporter solute-binding subunit [Lederbergia lenta]MEC2324030.1 TAXI family TRAP transporter solute-binding subunit [Lederbergia lenta]SQI60780.1 TRAP transporter solute receptor, TAXI family [Lederbergia lenta]